MRILARALESASATRSRIEKVKAVGSALRDAGARGDIEVRTAARVVVGRLLSPTDPRPLGVGFSVMTEAASIVRGVPDSWIDRRARELGDLGDAIFELVAAPTHEARRRSASGVEPTDPRQLSFTKGVERWALPPEAERHRGLALREVAELVDALADASAREDKVDLVAAGIARATAIEAKFFVKALLGELRVGVRGGIFEEALAEAFGASLDLVRAGAAVESDPGELAVAAARGALPSLTARVFHPVAFMLATPEETVATPIELALTVVEDKLDGVRAQLHAQSAAAGGEARLFARGHGDVGRSFPEIAAAFRAVPRAVILDGEILAVGPDQKSARPFQALQARLGRVEPDRGLIESVPVRYFVFDILYDDAPIFALPWKERRARLEALFAELGPATASLLDVSALASEVPLAEALDRAYEAARARGHEGIVLKRVDAAYEAGRRGAAWRKVKRAFATLDVVITAAERGTGRRASVLSDYTFAVWNGAELLDVGKAYSGLTDVEIKTMTDRLDSISIERTDGYHRVRPEIVLEVAFDGIQRSQRHPSGFALRFPRINRIRADKTPEDADTLETVSQLFEAQVKTGHREDVEPTVDAPRGKKAKKSTAQMDLFGGGGPERKDD